MCDRFNCVNLMTLKKYSFFMINIANLQIKSWWVQDSPIGQTVRILADWSPGSTRSGNIQNTISMLSAECENWLADRFQFKWSEWDNLPAQLWSWRNNSGGKLAKVNPTLSKEDFPQKENLSLLPGLSLGVLPCDPYDQKSISSREKPFLL